MNIHTFHRNNTEFDYTVLPQAPVGCYKIWYMPCSLLLKLKFIHLNSKSRCFRVRDLNWLDRVWVERKIRYLHQIRYRGCMNICLFICFFVFSMEKICIGSYFREEEAGVLPKRSELGEEKGNGIEKVYVGLER